MIFLGFYLWPVITQQSQVFLLHLASPLTVFTAELTAAKSPGGTSGHHTAPINPGRARESMLHWSVISVLGPLPGQLVKRVICGVARGHSCFVQSSHVQSSAPSGARLARSLSVVLSGRCTWRLWEREAGCLRSICRTWLHSFAPVPTAMASDERRRCHLPLGFTLTAEIQSEALIGEWSAAITS